MGERAVEKRRTDAKKITRHTRRPYPARSPSRQKPSSPIRKENATPTQKTYPPRPQLIHVSTIDSSLKAVKKLQKKHKKEA